MSASDLPGHFDVLATCLVHRGPMFFGWTGSDEPRCDACEGEADLAFRQRGANAAHARVLTRQAARRRWLRGKP